MRQGPSPLCHPAHAVLFAFVCSVLEFSLQCAGLLFAACNSFVCSVLEFCLQCAGVLFAVCWSFVCSVRKFCLQHVGVLFAVRCSFVCSVREFYLQRVFFYSFFFVCSVEEVIFLTCYLCLQGIFLFAMFSLCESSVPSGPP